MTARNRLATNLALLNRYVDGMPKLMAFEKALLALPTEQGKARLTLLQKRTAQGKNFKSGESK